MAAKWTIEKTVLPHTWWLAAMICTLMGVSIWSYTVDDAFIVFRYARNLVDGHGPVFNIGQQVEGFTSPLWLGVTALAQALELPAEHASKVFGLGAIILLIWYVAHTLRDESPAVQLPLLLLATNGPLVVGAIGGLETGINAAIIVCMLLVSHRGTPAKPQADWRALAVWGSLALLCRPENAVLVGAQGLYLWSARPKQRRELRFAAIAWLALMGALTIARFVYYGSLIPNTAIAKLTVEAAAQATAWPYVLTWCKAFGWLAVLGVPVLLSKKTRGLAGNAWLLIIAQLFFVFMAGGDWMPQWRFMLPIGAILIVLGCYSVGVVMNAAKVFSFIRFIGNGPRHVAMTICAAAIFIGCGLQVWQFRTARWGLDSYCRMLSDLDAGPVSYISYHADPDDVVVARDIGVLGYRTRCRILDVVGLTDPHVAKTSGLRHRNQIDCDYIYGLKPDFLMLQSEHDGSEPIPLGRIARVLVADYRFSDYEFRGRWNLPGRQYCEVYERRSHTGPPARSAVAHIEPEF